MNFPQVPPEVAGQLIAAAACSPHREICGFITHDWRIVPIRNVAAGDRSFAMDEDELMKLMVATEGRLLGIYHSHPGGDPYPSDTDETFAYTRYYRYFIVTAQGFYEWDFSDGKPKAINAAGQRFAEDMAYPLFTAPEKIRHHD
jgi:proteasome lid subunit RPN8/RPN11